MFSVNLPWWNCLLAACSATFNWHFCWLLFSQNADEQTSEEECVHLLHITTENIFGIVGTEVMLATSRVPPRPSTRSAQRLSMSHRSTCMFSSAPRVFTSHIRLSATENLASTQTHPTPSKYITTLPQRPHSTLLLSKGYPSAPEPNSSRVSRERSARLHGASPEKAPASPDTAKKCYKILRELPLKAFF